MKSVLQRVTRAQLLVEEPERIEREIGVGLVVLTGITIVDSDVDIAWTAGKIAGLRIFEDAEGKMNRGVIEAAGSVLLVPNFTLAGDARKGRRPSFDQAMAPERAAPMFGALAAALVAQGVTVQTGVFRAHMRVTIVNDGPVTILLDSRAPAAT